MYKDVQDITQESEMQKISTCQKKHSEDATKRDRKGKRTCENDIFDRLCIGLILTK
jgi:hypothetical protein